MKALRGGGLAALLVVAACASVPASPPSSASLPGDSAPAVRDPALDSSPSDVEPFQQALQRAAASPRGVRLRVEVGGRVSRGPAQLSLLGQGVGVWSRSRQIAVPETKEREILSLLLESNFAGLDRVYGGRERDRRQPPVVRHSIAVEIDDHAKISVQLVAGEQFAPLAGLVEHLLAVGEELAASGLEAPDLATGLARVADGTLSTAVWSLVAQSLPGVPEPCDAGRFWLRLDVRRFEAAPAGCDGALGERRRLELPDSELRELATLLASRATALQSSTARATEPFELAVEVLAHRRSLQARPQSRSGIEHTESLDQLHDTLRQLANRVLRDGRPVATP